MEKKTRWLDVGNGGNFEKGFYYLDILSSKKPRFFQKDILHLEKADLVEMGRFDYVRMQHFFEHFTPEEGLIVLANAADLLSPGGIITISVPDLRIFVDSYLNKRFDNLPKFIWWANKRIPLKSPASFYFSVFAHSMPWEQHKWCYDYEGLEYQLQKTGLFVNIREIKVDDELACVPFTHNRPKEDVCIIASRK